MYRAGIIGYPLGHSISPVFQQAAFEHRGLEAVYEAWETPAESLDALLAWLRSTPGVWGANVTVPHKEAVFERVDHLDPLATAVGAVNTVVVRNGELSGYNTDVPGFLRALRQDGGFDPAGKRVLLLGAGGAARAATTALASSGAAHLTIANRTVERAEELVEAARSGGLAAQAVPLDDDALAQVRGPTPWDLIVNATSMGMRGSSAEHQNPMAAALIPRTALVFDLVYNPPITPFLEVGLAAGAQVLSGLPMLMYQGAEAFTLWTGVEAPVEVMLTAARDALGSGRSRPQPG